MSMWADWIPGVSNVKGALQGNWGQAFGGAGYTALAAGKKHFFDDPANAEKTGLDQAMQQSNQGTEALKNFYAQQQQKALGYYKPLQHMFDAAYGTEGLQAPVLPGRGAK